ncbi:MAG: hypothetical protein NZL93_00265 [Chthoniobacterales bacterium]|nr:hypothetical protein [Chthoniobacterales bacterium]
MEPVTTLIAAKLGADLLRTLTGNVVNQQQAAQEREKMEQAVRFEQLLRQVAANPRVQKAAYLAAENIRTPEDAEFRLGDCAARIFDDPHVQAALGGRTEPVQFRFLDKETVEITTREGIKKIVRLEGQALAAVAEARQILDCLYPAINRPNPPYAIRYIPGTGVATLL